MASSRIARIALEVAPPQFVTVMRRRASKMMDTIQEEKEYGSSTGNIDYVSSKPRNVPNFFGQSSSSSAFDPPNVIAPTSASKYFFSSGISA